MFRPSPRLCIDACSKADIGVAADANLSILAGLECACHRGKLFFIKNRFSIYPSAFMDLAEDADCFVLILTRYGQSQGLQNSKIELKK